MVEWRGRRTSILVCGGRGVLRVGKEREGRVEWSTLEKREGSRRDWKVMGERKLWRGGR